MAIPKVLNFVNGQLVPPAEGKYLDSFSPATGKVHYHIPDSTASDVEAAIDAAETAFDAWADLPRDQKAIYLNRIADKIEAGIDEFARAESQDQGKPVWLAKSVDIPRAIKNFRFFANAILNHVTTSTEVDGVALNYSQRSPVGVAALITPWNLPLYLLTWKIAPCIALGNTCVCKPSELTSVTASMLCQIFIEVGLPKGVVNIVFGTGPSVGEPLVKHPKISLVSFTGGTVTGRHIQTLAAPSFKKTSLELGGKNPSLVFPDVDLDECVPAMVKSCFTNQGEICLAISRIFVHESIYDQFCQKLVLAMQ